LRRAFGSKSAEVSGGRTTWCSQEVHYFHFSPYIILLIKQSSMAWLGHEIRVEERRGAHSGFGGERENLLDQGVDGKIILKCVLKKYYGRGMD